MQLPVDIPLNKIGNNKHNKKLNPDGKTLHFQRYKVRDPENREKIFKQFYPNIGKRIETNERKKKKVE